MNDDTRDHLTAFFDTFVSDRKRARYIAMLETDTRLKKLQSYDLHNLELNTSKASKVPPSERWDAIAQRLKRAGAPDECLVFADTKNPEFLLLEKALEELIMAGDSAIVSCIPGKLAYYQTEAPSTRYILKTE